MVLSNMPISPGLWHSRVSSDYPQPTLVAFDPADPDILVAGGADSGVFISTNGGTRWQLVTDPFAPGTSGVHTFPGRTTRTSITIQREETLICSWARAAEACGG